MILGFDRLLLTLGVMAAVLVGIIGLELHGNAPDEAPIFAPPTRGEPESPARSSSSDVPRSQVAEHVVTTILARPLFSPSRRPPVVETSSDASSTALARLTGVIVSPAAKSAIFAGPGEGKPVVVGEGAHIGEYGVGRIDVDGVTITGPEGQRVLHPAYDPSPPKRGMSAPIVAPVVLGPLSRLPVAN